MVHQCYKCKSFNIKKNGHSKNGNQQYRCNDCCSGFVEKTNTPTVSETMCDYIKKALFERISLRGITRMFGVSMGWLLSFMNKVYKDVPDDLGFNGDKIDLELELVDAEADEMWSFVGSKKNPVWIWIIIDRNTRQVIAYHAGSRKKVDAKKLWRKIPVYIRKKLLVYTDFLKSYNAAIPAKRHIASGKEAGNTNHIERLNCTIRQRVSRLVRSSLSFSKKLENHIAALGYFFFCYNKELNMRI